MKLTKAKIEELVKEIEDFLRKHELLGDVCIYFNNKRHHWEFSCETYDYKMQEKTDISPLDYFEYVNPEHILSMSFEGYLYEVLNGYAGYALEEKFTKLFEKYNLYYELGNAWNLSCYPIKDDMEIEFTDYKADIKPDPVVIYSHSTPLTIPLDLYLVKTEWDKLSTTTQDLGGSCTIGDGFEFTYKGAEYFMMPPSYQGSCIYEHWIDKIKEKLKEIGAENIHYNCGRLD